MSKVIIYDNGDKYVGDIKNKEKHGIGTYTWSDGSTYFGEWKNNKKHGHGTFKDTNGDYVSTGVYLLLIYGEDGTHKEEKITVIKQ